MHALREMRREAIDLEDVREALRTGVIIESYLDDRPYPSRLMLGWSRSRPIHIVAAERLDGTIIVVTVYEPDPKLWQDDLRKRKPR
jgi:hypothetical protein